jgi:signal peptidase I
MSDLIEKTPSQRIPATARKLSSFCAGLGHIYCGQFTKGMVLLALSLLPAPILVAAVFSKNPSVILWGIVGPCAFAIGVYTYAMIFSSRLAAKIGDAYELKDYNNGVVYSIFAVGNLYFSVIVAFAIAMYFRSNVMEAFYCPSESMSPTILKGDRFLANKLVQRKQPRYGDIVVFLAPNDRDTIHVKRVVGLPGDTVAVQGTDVFVNGRKLAHQSDSPRKGTLAEESIERLMFETNGDATYAIRFMNNADNKEKIADCPKTEIPSGHCFVLGDNRDNSHDSRKYGLVPLGDILGKAEYLYFPVSNWSRFGAIGR